MLAYYIDHFSPFILGPWNIGPLHEIGVRWYGTAYVMAFLLGVLMLKWFARRGYSELPEEKVSDFIAATALFGVLLGGRLGYFLFYDFKGLMSNPLEFFQVWKGGMASHGGILGIVIFTFWYAWRHKVTWMGLGDNIAVAAPLGIFFGRCANFINGELFGRIAHGVSWAMQFPKEIVIYPPENFPNLFNPEKWQAALDACMKIDPSLNNAPAIADAAETSEPVRAVLAGILNPRYPSQLMEAGLEGLLLFALLWFIRTRTRVVEGVTTGMFFVLYATVRILGEQFREPDVGVAFTLGLTRGQFLSLFMIVFGVAFILNAIRRNRPAPRPG